MASKSSYLTLVNKLLARISQAPVNAIPASGHGGIIANLLNEAQNYLYTEVNWYSLYGQRTWQTYLYTASTISFLSGNPSSINDSANGLGSFLAGMTLLISGSTNNSYVCVVNTATAGSITLTSDEIITTEVAGSSITITQVTYPVAADFGRCQSLQDLTDSRILIEDVVQDFAAEDPQQKTTSTPTHFAIDGYYYRLYPIPAAISRMRERYLKTPPVLVNTTDTSALPIECENALIHYAYYQLLDYLQKYDVADRERLEFRRQLDRAKASNFRVIDQWHRMGGGTRIGQNDGISMPRFPATYGPRYF